MQFLITGMDGTDDDAINRRLAVRDAHIALGNKMRDEGLMLYGAALLNDSERMIGSVLICEFASRNQLDEWLKVEPYVTGDVWKEIKVTRCRVGPSFTGLVAQTEAN